MSNFFIDRPIFAWVLAIVMMLAGGLAIKSLPVSQYPSIAPPAVAISVIYPGASADTVQSSVVQVIEQQLSGLDHLLYFSSESDKDGSMTITLNFEQGTNPDIAQVQVQNKLQLATPLLPPEVQQQGIRVAKATKNFLMVVGFYSKDDSMSDGDIADYIASNLQDAVSRTAGVGDYQLFGSQYAMRIWLDPAKLNNFSLTPVDVSAAIQAQNVQIASGEIGGLPQSKGQELTATIIGPARLRTAEQFGAIVLKALSGGSQVRLRDVARIGLDSESYSFGSQYNGHPAAGIAIKLASGANALDTAKAVRATIDKFSGRRPPSLETIYPYDTTPFVRVSIGDVIETLFEAIGLVFVVMFVFLQNIRATIIPTLAVPVVLLGTLALLYAFGFSINVLTTFGMVLAIGLLVDDAIVVVENVERVMEEEGLSPRDATRKSMGQITGALVGIALVLSAVFLPMAFFGGSTGVIYRQFSITMASAMGLSVVTALIFTPALCATILRPLPKKAHERGGFFGWFNRTFDRGSQKYQNGVSHMLKRIGRYFLIFAVIVGLMVFLFLRIPKAFLPDEDQGIMFVQVLTTPGSTRHHMEEVLARIRDYYLNDEKATVEGIFTITGFSFAGHGQNAGLAFVRMKPWDERKESKNKVPAITVRANQHFAQYDDAFAIAFGPPAVPELGNSTGFDVELMDDESQGHDKLMQARNQLLGAVMQDKIFSQVRPNGLEDEPQYLFNVDWEKAMVLGLTVPDITSTLSAAWGSQYVNDFIDRGRVKRVFIQGDAPSRMLPQDLTDWYVRNMGGLMVPFSSFSRGTWATGSPKLERYNGIPSVEILGQPAPGVSTGTALDTLQKMAAKLPKGFSLDYTGLSFEERLSGSQAGGLYAISLIVVFLCLAALYESWSVPVAVLLVVPLGIIGAVLATLGRGLNNDVFFQVGLLTTVGLSAKNAILIVEFAKENHDKGMELIESTELAARQRLRPIIMTSMAFILGVFPLAISRGAGAGGQNAIGTGVVGGMLTATLLAIYFVPMFFVQTVKLFGSKSPHRTPPGPTPENEAPSRRT